MFIIYDLIFLLFALICLPVYLAQRKFHRGFSARLGALPAGLEFNKPIWIHAVSVGEVMAVKGLLEGLRSEFKAKKLVISTVTPTGNKIARAIACADDLVTYLPLDLSFIVGSVMDRLKPSLFIIAETEIWPNLIGRLYRKKIPIIAVNCRISDKSFKGYLMIRFFISRILNKIDLFCAQSVRDAEKLLRLGVSAEKIKVTGNMKFDTGSLQVKFDTAVLRLDEQGQLLVCGSTHPGEEAIILEVYRKLIGQMPSLRLLLAPRHPQRVGEVEGIIVRQGFSPVRISRINPPVPSQGRGQTNQPEVFILDTVGQLVSCYAIADIVFVGGSLVKKGGHNILEPASLAKPILFGPQMFNFRDIADLFLKSRAAISVRNQQELEERIRYLLNNPAVASGMGEKARRLVLENRGATHRNLELIKGIYAGLPL